MLCLPAGGIGLNPSVRPRLEVSHKKLQFFPFRPRDYTNTRFLLKLLPVDFGIPCGSSLYQSVLGLLGTTLYQQPSFSGMRSWVRAPIYITFFILHQWTLLCVYFTLRVIIQHHHLFFWHPSWLCSITTPCCGSRVLPACPRPLVKISSSLLPQCAQLGSYILAPALGAAAPGSLAHRLESGAGCTCCSGSRGFSCPGGSEPELGNMNANPCPWHVWIYFCTLIFVYVF